MGNAAQPNPALRKLLLVLLIVGGTLLLWSIYLGERLRWIELSGVLIWTAIAFQVWLFPSDWRMPPFARLVMVLLCFALSASSLIDFFV